MLYRNQPPQMLLKTYLRMLFSKDPKAARILSVKLSEQHDNKRFQADMGLTRNPKCTSCTKDKPCPTLTSKDIHDVIAKQFGAQREEKLALIEKDIKYHEDNKITPTEQTLAKRREMEHEHAYGYCQSCGMYLSMWDAKRDVQMISGWTLCFFNANACKTPALKNDLRVYCRGCTAMAEMTYLDFDTFNFYRRMLFKNAGEKFVSDGYFFPRIDNVDEKLRYVRVGSIKQIGSRSELSKKWNRQKGFPVYRLSPSLEKELSADPTWVQRILDANHPNDNCMRSEYYFPDDQDLKEPSATAISRAARKLTKAGTTTSTTSGGGGAATKKIKLDPVDDEESKMEDGDDISDEELMKLLTKQVEDESKLDVDTSQVVAGPDNVGHYQRQPLYFVPKIPINPCKLARGRNLLALALTKMDPTLDDDEKNKENIILTNKLMFGFEQKFERDQWMRWLFDVGRLVTPLFVPKKQMTQGFSEAERKLLEDAAKRIAEEKVANDRINELKTAVRKSHADRMKLMEPLRPKLISLLESNTDLKELKELNLKPSITEGGRTRATMKESRLGELLPIVLSDSVIRLVDNEGDEITGRKLEEVCAELAKAAYDKVKVPARKVTRFNLVYKDKNAKKKKGSVPPP